MQPSNHEVLITGGSKGIGLALARKFHGAGNDIAIVGRGQDALDAVSQELSGVKTIQADGGVLWMSSYYSEKLAGHRLKQCYDLAPPMVRRCLAAEIEFVGERIRPGSRVLELGCGYGRVLRELASPSSVMVGIDTSLESLCMAWHYVAGVDKVTLVQMNAIELGFPPASFDLVYCVQNGVSAFHVDQRALLGCAVAVTKQGGCVLFSSYSEGFWEQRLTWFRVQASHGLVGEVDEAATGDGAIVCKDGFTATTVSPHQFSDLSRGLGIGSRVETVDGSSVFCEIRV